MKCPILGMIVLIIMQYSRFKNILGIILREKTLEALEP